MELRHQDDFARYAPFYEVIHGLGGLNQRSLGRDWWVQAAVAHHRHELAKEGPVGLLVAEGPCAPVDSDDRAVVEEHLVERQRGNGAGRETDDAEAPRPTGGAQGGLAVASTDGVD